MMLARRPRTGFEPALKRLAALAPLDGRAQEAVIAAMERGRTVAARRELLSEGQPIREPLLLLDGWAARQRILADGRRQLVNLILPGDLIGYCDQPEPVASSSIVAMTELWLCPAPSPDAAPGLEEAYAVSRAREENYLIAQITRLGRMNAHERIADLMLEILERLELAGLAEGNRFTCPLTQEVVGDILGLTSVHVNRMVQQSRSLGELSWADGVVRLLDPVSLRRMVGREKAHVSNARLARF